MIVVDKELLGDPKHTETKEQDEECFNELVTKLLLIEDPRYILYAYRFRNEENLLIQGLAFIVW